MIGIIDYGMGNLGSVENACRFLNLKAQLITAPEEMARCRALILPGQGAFGDCMQNLNQAGFSPAVKAWIKEDKPLLGVCIGMQILFEGSEESPDVPGLGVLPGVLKKFPPSQSLKVPQMGWNRVLQPGGDHPMFSEIPDRAFFYFVHSYYVEKTDADWVAGETEYGFLYTSVIHRSNLFATQFHPEKSQEHGLQLLRNFSAFFDQEI